MKRRMFLSETMPMDRVVSELMRLLNAATAEPSTLVLPHDVGLYLAGAGVAVERRRGRAYETPQYVLATRDNGSLTTRAYNWAEINGLESEALEFNHAQIRRYVASQSEQLRLRRQACVDEIKSLDLDLAALEDMLMAVV